MVPSNRAQISWRVPPNFFMTRGPCTGSTFAEKDAKMGSQSTATPSAASNSDARDRHVTLGDKTPPVGHTDAKSYAELTKLRPDLLPKGWQGNAYYTWVTLDNSAVGLGDVVVPKEVYILAKHQAEANPTMTVDRLLRQLRAMMSGSDMPLTIEIMESLDVIAEMALRHARNDMEALSGGLAHTYVWRYAARHLLLTIFPTIICYLCLPPIVTEHTTWVLKPNYLLGEAWHKTLEHHVAGSWLTKLWYYSSTQVTITNKEYPHFLFCAAYLLFIYLSALLRANISRPRGLYRVTQGTLTKGSQLVRTLDGTPARIDGTLYTTESQPNKLTRVMGVCNNLTPVVNGNTAADTHAAVLKRLVKPDPYSTIDNPTILSFRRFVAREMNCHSGAVSEAMNRSDWLKRYPKPTQRDLNLAEHGEFDHKMHSHAVFAKTEKHSPGEFDDERTNLIPRIITSASPAYLNEIGPWIAAAADYLKGVFGPGEVNVWGISQPDILGDAIADAAEDAEVCIEGDFSSFDGTISHHLLAAELMVYRILGFPPHIIDLLAKMNRTSARTPSGSKANYGPARRSGDANTSLGNTLINILVTRHIIHERFGESYHYLGGSDVADNTIYFAAGDDCLMFGPKELAKVNWVKEYAKYGLVYKPKVHHAPDLVYKVTFLGGRVYPVVPVVPTPDAKLWCLGPKIGAVVNAYNYAGSHNLTDVGWRRVVKADALGRLKHGAFVPIYRAQAAAMVEALADVSAKNLLPGRLYVKPAPSMRYEFDEFKRGAAFLDVAYGLSFDQVYEIEALVQDARGVDDWSHPVILDILEVDDRIAPSQPILGLNDEPIPDDYASRMPRKPTRTSIHPDPEHKDAYDAPDTTESEDSDHTPPPPAGQPDSQENPLSGNSTSEQPPKRIVSETDDSGLFEAPDGTPISDTSDTGTATEAHVSEVSDTDDVLSESEHDIAEQKVSLDKPGFCAVTAVANYLHKYAREHNLSNATNRAIRTLIKEGWEVDTPVSLGQLRGALHRIGGTYLVSDFGQEMGFCAGRRQPDLPWFMVSKRDGCAYYNHVELGTVTCASAWPYKLNMFDAKVALDMPPKQKATKMQRAVAKALAKVRKSTKAAKTPRSKPQRTAPTKSRRVAVATSHVDRASAIRSRPERTTHREKLADVTNTVTISAPFSMMCYPTSTYLTWLRARAACFNTYVVNSVTFKFVSYTATTTPGYVALAWDPSASELPTGLTDAQIANWRRYTKASAWESNTLTITHSELMGTTVKKRIVPSTPTADYDSTTFGRFVAYSSGDSGIKGELQIVYDISFSDPQQPITLTGTGTQTTSAQTTLDWSTATSHAIPNQATVGTTLRSFTMGNIGGLPLSWPVPHTTWTAHQYATWMAANAVNYSGFTNAINSLANTLGLPIFASVNDVAYVSPKIPASDGTETDFMFAAPVVRVKNVGSQTVSFNLYSAVEFGNNTTSKAFTNPAGMSGNDVVMVGHLSGGTTKVLDGSTFLDTTATTDAAASVGKRSVSADIYVSLPPNMSLRFGFLREPFTNTAFFGDPGVAMALTNIADTAFYPSTVTGTLYLANNPAPPAANSVINGPCTFAATATAAIVTPIDEEKLVTIPTGVACECKVVGCSCKPKANTYVKVAPPLHDDTDSEQESDSEPDYPPTHQQLAALLRLANSHKK